MSSFNIKPRWMVVKPLAVDDFGTGYSSPGYLRRFPIGEIKVDKSFVEDMDNRCTLAIIKAIVALGRSLDMKVTA